MFTFNDQKWRQNKRTSGQYISTTFLYNTYDYETAAAVLSQIIITVNVAPKMIILKRKILHKTDKFTRHRTDETSSKTVEQLLSFLILFFWHLSGWLANGPIKDHR